MLLLAVVLVRRPLCFLQQEMAEEPSTCRRYLCRELGLLVFFNAKKKGKGPEGLQMGGWDVSDQVIGGRGGKP